MDRLPSRRLDGRCETRAFLRSFLPTPPMGVCGAKEEVMRTLSCLSAAVLLSAAGAALAVPPPPPLVVRHDANLNWDVVVPSNVVANDFEIILERGDWVPPNVYVGGLGFPQYQVTYGDFVPSDPGLETKVRWFGREFAPGSVTHVGANLYGSGRLLEAYFTRDGAPVGDRIGLIYELTRVTIPIGFDLPTLAMELTSNPAFVNAGLGTMELRNIRTFANMPASLLDLADLNPTLNLGGLSGYEVPALPPTLGITASSFFDVFLDVTPLLGPDYEALLVAEMWRLPVVGQPIRVGQFYNLNAQCPEPSVSLGLLGASVLLLRRSRSGPRRG
jgi:hypothetical protein